MNRADPDLPPIGSNLEDRNRGVEVLHSVGSTVVCWPTGGVDQ